MKTFRIQQSTLVNIYLNIPVFFLFTWQTHYGINRHCTFQFIVSSIKVVYKCPYYVGGHLKHKYTSNKKRVFHGQDTFSTNQCTTTACVAAVLLEKGDETTNGLTDMIQTYRTTTKATTFSIFPNG